MTEKNNIRNLIWVWNPQSSIFSEKDWNPGSKYYDVIGVDIYNKAFDYQSNVATFKSMAKTFGIDKIFTLSENGPIPDASLMQADSAVWSWYMPWYESWDGGFVSKTKKTVWEANLATSCVYTLDKMAGWSNYTISTAKEDPCDVEYKLGDLDTAVELQVVTPDTSKGDGWLKVVVNNMHHKIDNDGDTILYAGANICISSSVDHSGATTASFTAYNTSLDGVWICIAILTDVDWKWQMPPEVKWLNAGDSTLCTFDVSGMEMDRASKIYIMISTPGYSGTIYFDNFTTDKGTVANFNNTSDLFEKNGEGADTFITSLTIVGGSRNDAKTKHIASSFFSYPTRIALQGKKLLVSLENSGNYDINIFDIQGHQIVNLNRGLLPIGTHSFSLNKLSKGFYIIRTSGSFGVANNPVILK